MLVGKPLISVVVCTYNRANLLGEALRSLVAQTLDASYYEVLVINNNSTDDTQDLAEEFAARHGNFRAVEEKNQGLSFSRNRGWQEAKGEYVAYIDDDALATPDWLVEIRAFLSRCPGAGAFGGPYEAFTLVSPPAWFPPEYGTKSLGEEEREVEIGLEWISGTNMVFRRNLLEELGGFDSALGMRGLDLGYGEETRLLIELSEMKIPIYYVPKMKVKHLVAEYKMSLRWLLRSANSIGRNAARTFGQRGLVVRLYGLTRGLWVMLRNLITFRPLPLKRRMFYALSPLLAEVGATIEFIRRRGGCVNK